MPQYISAKIHVPISLLSARVLFPFGISFFIPLFVYTLTTEKQSRIFIMMKVNHIISFLIVDEWSEDLAIFPRSLYGFCSFSRSIYGYLSPDGIGISFGNHLNQSRANYHSIAYLDQHSYLSVVRSLQYIRQCTKCPSRNIHPSSNEHRHFNFCCRYLGQSTAKSIFHMATLRVLHCRCYHQCPSHKPGCACSYRTHNRQRTETGLGYSVSCGGMDFIFSSCNVWRGFFLFSNRIDGSS